MIAHFNWFVGTLFLIAAFGALMNPPPYIAISILFFIMGLLLLPSTKKIAKQYLDWEIKGGAKGAIVLISFIVICLIVPQVETDPSKFSHRLADQIEELN